MRLNDWVHEALVHRLPAQGHYHVSVKARRVSLSHSRYAACACKAQHQAAQSAPMQIIQDHQFHLNTLLSI